MRQAPFISPSSHHDTQPHGTMSDLSISTPPPSPFGCNATVNNFDSLCTSVGGNSSEPRWCSLQDEASVQRFQTTVSDAGGNWFCHNAAQRLSKPHALWIGSLAAVSLALAVVSCC